MRGLNISRKHLIFLCLLLLSLYVVSKLCVRNFAASREGRETRGVALGCVLALVADVLSFVKAYETAAPRSTCSLEFDGTFLDLHEDATIVLGRCGGGLLRAGGGLYMFTADELVYALLLYEVAVELLYEDMSFFSFAPELSSTSALYDGRRYFSSPIKELLRIFALLAMPGSTTLSNDATSLVSNLMEPFDSRRGVEGLLRLLPTITLLLSPSINVGVEVTGFGLEEPGGLYNEFALLV